MFDSFSMTNTILYSFIQRKKLANKPFQELTKKFARNLVLARLRYEKGDKTSTISKVVASDVVGAQLF